jgi:hypothetical protein
MNMQKAINSVLLRGDNDDHVYYNISIPNNGTVPIPASFAESRTTPLISDPSQYYLSVVRFNIPSSLIPLLNFPDPPSTNSRYSITLHYRGADYRQFLQYIPYNNLLPTNPLSQAVYSYGQMCDMINTAFALAFTALQTANPGLTDPSLPPLIVYNPVTNLFSILVQPSYNLSNEGFAITIYMNTLLYGFFQNFESSFFGNNTLNGKDYQILTNTTNLFQQPLVQLSQGFTGAPTWNNATTYGAGAIVFYLGQYYQSVAAGNVAHQPNTSPAFWNNYTGFDAYNIIQESISNYLFSGFRNISFVSGSIPVLNENLNAQQQTNALGPLTGGSNSRSILTDFEPSILSGDAKSNYQYFPQGEYRLIELQSTDPLKKMDITIYYQDQFQNLYPVMIPPQSLATIKILFRRKGVKSGLGY